jgi:pimeloyl-ACP methyl ester carboxylesterase
MFRDWKLSATGDIPRTFRLPLFRGCIAVATMVRLNVCGAELTGILGETASKSTRPLIVCLHGGTYTSHYFNFTSQGSDTLFAIASTLGFPILALDRPGYAANAGKAMPFDAQAAILSEATTCARRLYAPASAGIFLVGHSIGAMIAMLTAAYHRPEALVGLDLSGAGLAYRAEAFASLSAYAAMTDPPRRSDPQRRRERMFGPLGTYHDDVVAEDLARAPLSQPAEIVEALEWQERVHAVAADIDCPVRCVIADADALWEAGPAFESGIRKAFSRSRRIDVATQNDAGHCLHLHRIARAANLRTLAFAEELWTVGSKCGASASSQGDGPSDTQPGP